MRLSGRFQVKEFSDLSLVQVDDDNRKLFEEFEEKLRHLSRSSSLKLTKENNFYLKIYTKPNGKTNVKFWELFEKDGKEYRRHLGDPGNLIKKNFEGEAVFSLDNIYVVKNKKGELIPKSIISVAEEVIVREVLKEQSYFEEEYPVWEDSEDEEVDHLTPSPWKREKDLDLGLRI